MKLVRLLALPFLLVGALALTSCGGGYYYDEPGYYGGRYYDPDYYYGRYPDRRYYDRRYGYYRPRPYGYRYDPYYYRGPRGRYYPY